MFNQISLLTQSSGGKKPPKQISIYFEGFGFLNEYQKILQIRNEIQDVPLI